MAQIPPHTFYSGTSGLVLPVPNKLSYPPEFRDKPRLSYYASLFNSIEVNSSFYKVPRADTVGKWADSVPEDFRFTFKLHRGITHQKGLVFEDSGVTDFFRVINMAGAKKGCLLVQFPASTKIAQAGQLEKLLQVIRDSDPDEGWKLAVEFRDPSWYNRAIYTLLENFRATVVLHDMPGSATPLTGPAAPMAGLRTDLVYLRFHGQAGDYRGSYPDTVLCGYAQRVREWMEQGKTVYVYFNNTIGQAVKNVADLARMVEGADTADVAKAVQEAVKLGILS